VSEDRGDIRGSTIEKTRSRDLEDEGGLLPWFVVSIFPLIPSFL